MAERRKEIVIEIHVLINITHRVEVNKSEQYRSQTQEMYYRDGLAGLIRTKDENSYEQIGLHFPMVVPYHAYAQYLK